VIRDVLTLTVATALLGAGCARKPDGRVAPKEAAAGADSVFIDVINDNYYDARVYAIYDGGARHPLGTIDGNQRVDRLAIPWRPRTIVFEVTLLVEGGTYRSDGMNVAAGDLVEIRLPPNIGSSVFFRRVSR
jgi:hypothetical protein